MTFQPDYTNLEKAARNIEAPRIPLYEHLINDTSMEQILGRKFAGLLEGDFEDKKEYFRIYTGFFREYGYDTVSFECCVGGVMPGGGLLQGHGLPPAIETRDDFEKYPWDEIEPRFFERFSDDFRALGEVMPAGMKAVGGVGNGIFECAQEIIGYENLCYMLADDDELSADVFRKIGETNLKIWKRFLREFGDLYCVCRFGDDLGYKSATMLPPDVIRQHVVPAYKPIVDAVHASGKPFLLHSCGNIFCVMDDLIDKAGIDAKHSNEDQIAMFPVWVEKYGDRIGNFGGIDTDCVCRLSEPEMREYITDVVRQCVGHGGFAFGSGNSIPPYVPTEGFLAMNRIIRELRVEN